MNSQRINSTNLNKNSQTANASSVSKETKRKDGQMHNGAIEAVGLKTGRKRIFFNLLIGYK